MRIANAVVGLVLLLFAAVQYNDPDFFLWASIYGIAAIWNMLAAFRPTLLARRSAGTLLGLSVVAGAAGLVWYWPDTPKWWMQDVWWQTETAREGMGMMIVFAALVLSAASAANVRRRG